MAAETRRLLDAWVPPEGAGQALACLATSFTFDPDFVEADCIGRLVGLDAQRGETSELAYLIEQEERLAETRVVILVDRGLAPEARSLRWDVLPVGVRRGVFHPKVALLVWERCLRAIIGSANLTPAGYRRQVEAAIVLDLDERSQVPRDLFDGLVAELRAIVAVAPGSTEAPGPNRRAIQILDLAAERVRDAGPARPGRIRSVIAPARPGMPALDALRSVWTGSPARRATILSPFFDADEDQRPVAAMVSLLARRNAERVTFVVPADEVAGRTVVRAPRALVKATPKRVAVSVFRFPTDEKESRRLHAKAIVLESDRWCAALLGSSNFTTAGLGLSDAYGNREVNIAVGAPADSDVARALRALIPLGEPIEPADVESWEPEEDDEREMEAIPWGFSAALYDPGSMALSFLLDADELPREWVIRLPTGSHVLSRDEWAGIGAPATVTVPLPPGPPPFLLDVAWADGAGWRHGAWIVNVTDPALLPPPDELRNLPVEALLEALASTRPMHEALLDAIARREAIGHTGDHIELDPLRRYSASGTLFARAKHVSAALAGLQRRLERPIGSPEALTWRLHGPFGPIALADGLLRDLADDPDTVPGEASFLIAETALTVRRTDWATAGSRLPPDNVRREVQVVLAALRDRARSAPPGDVTIAGYVRRALKECAL